MRRKERITSSDFGERADALRVLVEQQLADYWTCHRGQILYSGIDTLAPGKFYFLGFNPAADETNPLLCDVRLGMVDWSAYVHQCWYCGLLDRRSEPTSIRHVRCRHSTRAHQSRVVSVMSRLGIDQPERTFATNLFFIETKRSADLNVQRLWDPCWGVHRAMLGAVRPRFIVCLGNGEDRSAFSLLRSIAADKECAPPRGKLKKFVGTFSLGHGCSLRSTVIGVRHPSWSWMAAYDDLREFVGLAEL